MNSFEKWFWPYIRHRTAQYLCARPLRFFFNSVENQGAQPADYTHGSFIAQIQALRRLCQYEGVLRSHSRVEITFILTPYNSSTRVCDMAIRVRLSHRIFREASTSAVNSRFNVLGLLMSSETCISSITLEWSVTTKSTSRDAERGRQ